LRLRTKLAAVAISGATTVAFFGVGALTNSAHAIEPCTTGASASGAAVQTPLGCVSASGSAATQSGYVQADGAPSNPSALAGYIAVDSNNGGEVVGCSSGDYTPGGTNNVIASRNGGVTPPSATDPCNPAVP